MLTLGPHSHAASGKGDQSVSPSAIIFDNGGLATGANAGDGTAAPAGTQWSEAANPTGNTQQANTNAGISCGVTATVFRCADDFNVPVGQSWTINNVIVFEYMTGFTGTSSPVTAATLRIWNGRPGDPNSTIVFGDTTTNRLGTQADAGLYRVFSTVVGVGASGPTPPGTTRKVWQTGITVSPAAVLAPGNYWIDWNTQIGATTGHFSPPLTIKGTRGVPGQNSRQFTGTAWVDVTDVGQAPTGAPTPIAPNQDFPFKIDGSVTGAPLAPRSRTLDFDGDNKTDMAVARSANASSATTWYISNSAGGSSAAQWGTGVGFAGGDIATPADFDGDGKTDIAVWRSDPTAANFYILQSSNNTLKIQQFGQAGDDPTVVGDYDGDGKADVAVYRAGASAGAQSIWYYRPSATPATNFVVINWGSNGDKAYPGDFDGDKKFDASVVRNSGGNAVIYQNQTTGGSKVINYGLFTDKFITGDFDGDGRNDLAVARNNGTTYDWYVLMSGTGFLVNSTFGNSATDYLVPGDYDGDNRTDYGVWRSGAGNANFALLKTFTSPVVVTWGSSSGSLTSPDYPVGAINAH